MKAQSIKKNFVFQLLYKVLVLVIPLVLAPYLTRILGSTNLGVYTYANSIALYFVLFANLGIAKYGQRIIAARRENQEQLRKTFWSLYIDQVFFSILSSCAFLVYVFAFVNDCRDVFLLESFYVLSALFDLTWLFYGLENFQSVVLKNALIKIAECIAIFVFVKSQDDLWVYTLIMSLSVLAGQFVLLPRAVKEIKPIKVDKNNLLEHIKPMFVLFISVIASNLYTTFDKTLLGILSTKDDVAYYEYASKLVNIPKEFLGVIGVVMFPRACRSFAEKNYDEQTKNMDISVFLTCLFGFAFMFGLMGVGVKLAILYYGDGFLECGRAIVWLSPLIIIVMVGDVVRNEYLVPAGKDWLFTISIVVSAVLNLVLSILFIPIIGIHGAIIGTLTAETFGTIFQIVSSKKVYKISSLLKNAAPFFSIGLIMFIVVFFVDMYTPTTISWLLIEFFIGAGVYITLGLLVVLLFYRQYWNGMKEWLKKRMIKTEGNKND